MIIILNYRDKQNVDSVSSLITVWSDKLQLISDFENDLVITDFIFQENELYCLCHNKLKIFKLQNSKPKLNQVLDLDNLGKGFEFSRFDWTTDWSRHSFEAPSVKHQLENGLYWGEKELK